MIIIIICILIILLIIVISIIFSLKHNKSSENYKCCKPKPIPDEYPLISNYCDSGCNRPHLESPQFYMCPQLMLGSKELIDAAKKDGNDWAYYAVATHFNDKGGCGRCYQISYLPYCGKYWADDGPTGELCCMNGDGKCNYTQPYDCFQSQLSHCCLKGTCEKCEEWSGPTSDILQDENPDENACLSKNGTYCPGWCKVCKGTGGDCDKCKYFPTKPLIVQSFNTGIDCTPPNDDSAGQFDIYMGAGGLGANVGCADPDTIYQENTYTCSCESLSSSSSIILDDKLKNCNKCICDTTRGCDCTKNVNCSRNGIYGGGFYGGPLDKWPDYKEGHRNGGVSRFDMCDEILNVPGIRKSDKDWNGEKNWGIDMINACKLAMGNNYKSPINPYHGNWAIRFKEVECPENLSKVTGLRLKYPSKGYDGKPLPKPSPQLVKPTGREGKIEDGYPGFTSSMMDCCKPSCAVNDMVKAIKEKGNDIDPYYTSIYMCDKNGKKIYLNQEGIDKAYINQDDGEKTACYDSKDLPMCADKMKDYQTNCKSNNDCCSNICSIGKYNSICCPVFKTPDGDGNCK